MALSEDLPIYKETVKMLDRVTDLQNDLPRSMKFHLGREMVDVCMDMLMLIYEANMSADKQDSLYRLLLKQRRLQIIMRVCFRLKAFSTGRYAELIETLDSIGRQATQWKKKSKCVRS